MKDKYGRIFWIISCIGLSMNNLAAQAFKGCAVGTEVASKSNPNFEQKILDLVNAERKKKKLSPLQLHPRLSAAARYHAQDMGSEDYHNHESYDYNQGKGTRVCGTFQRIGAFTKGTSLQSLAENIAAGQAKPEDVFKDWMNSPGHKKNILGRNYTHLGVGYYANPKSEYKHYWVQTFGGK
jgi:uncharacterized protein YkwD